MFVLLYSKQEVVLTDWTEIVVNDADVVTGLWVRKKNLVLYVSSMPDSRKTL